MQGKSVGFLPAGSPVVVFCGQDGFAYGMLPSIEAMQKLAEGFCVSVIPYTASEADSIWSSDRRCGLMTRIENTYKSDAAKAHLLDAYKGARWLQRHTDFALAIYRWLEHRAATGQMLEPSKAMSLRTARVVFGGRTYYSLEADWRKACAIMRDICILNEVGGFASCWREHLQRSADMFASVFDFITVWRENHLPSNVMVPANLIKQAYSYDRKDDLERLSHIYPCKPFNADAVATEIEDNYRKGIH